jgi:hypothetical protein
LYIIPGDRRLAKEIPLNVAWLWFLNYNLEEAIPNHGVFSKARERFGPQVYQEFFRDTLARCKEANLIQGDKAINDATLVKANRFPGICGGQAQIS